MGALQDHTRLTERWCTDSRKSIWGYQKDRWRGRSPDPSWMELLRISALRNGLAKSRGCQGWLRTNGKKG